MLRKSFFIPPFSCLLLVACSSSPPSYLPSGSEPIVNIEANANDLVNVSAASTALTIANKTPAPVNVDYKLFWYDKNGVTQTVNQADSTPWLALSLAPKQTVSVPLVKPTAESANYRIYLRGK
ncbi:DUF1425 domain-containing protein [Glaesserella sp.]|uniref:DUF1425 domain-containing protein n=1 Tax=Glaesserella sp. TaxID=2094731 RepID=UPI0035A1225E